MRISTISSDKNRFWRSTLRAMMKFGVHNHHRNNDNRGSIKTSIIGMLLIMIIFALVENNIYVSGQVPLLLGCGSSLAEEVHKETANYFIGYMKRTVDVMYDAYGSGAGIKALFTSNGAYSYAATDYGLKESDMLANADAKVLPIMATYISIIYNIDGLAGQKITLSQDALVGIFNGTISKWNDNTIQTLNPSLAFPNASINIVLRNDSSGTTDMLTSGLSLFSKEWASQFGKGTRIAWSPLLGNRTIYAEDAKDVSFIISSTLNTIGYSTPTTFEHYQPATIISKLGSPITPSASYLKTVLSKGLAFDKNFIYPSSIIVGSDIYPFVGISYLVYLSTTMTDCQKATYLAKFLEYYVSDRVSKIIDEAGFTSLTTDPTFKEKYLGELKNFTCNGQQLLNSSIELRFHMAILWMVLIIQFLCIL